MPNKLAIKIVQEANVFSFFFASSLRTSDSFELGRTMGVSVQNVSFVNASVSYIDDMCFTRKSLYIFQACVCVRISRENTLSAGGFSLLSFPGFSRNDEE